MDQEKICLDWQPQLFFMFRLFNDGVSTEKSTFLSELREPLSSKRRLCLCHETSGIRHFLCPCTYTTKLWEPVWTLWRTEKSFAIFRIRTPVPRLCWAVAVCNWGTVRRLLTPWCILTVTVFLMYTADKEAHYLCSGLSTRFTLIKAYLVRLVDKQS